MSDDDFDDEYDDEERTPDSIVPTKPCGIDTGDTGYKEALVGLIRVAGGDGSPYGRWNRKWNTKAGYPPGTTFWRETTNGNDCLKPYDRFVSAGDESECVSALEATFPVSDLRFTRVLHKGNVRHTCGSHILDELRAHQYVVMPERTYLGGNIAELAELASTHGPVFIDRRSVGRVRADGAEEGEGLTVSEKDCGSGFARVTYNPVRAKAAVKAQKTIAAKLSEKQKIATAASTLRRRVDDLTGSLLENILSAFEVYRVVCHGYDERDDYMVDDTLDLGKSSRRYRYVKPGKRVAVDRLRQAVRLHQQFFGKRAYRKNDEWKNVLAAFLGLEPGTRSPQCGCTDDQEECEAFLHAEMKWCMRKFHRLANKDKPKPKKTAKRSKRTPKKRKAARTAVAARKASR